MLRSHQQDMYVQSRPMYENSKAIIIANMYSTCLLWTYELDNDFDPIPI